VAVGLSCGVLEGVGLSFGFFQSRTKRNPKSSQDIFIISPSSVGAFKSKTIKGKG
jgi:hypothetical protein